ncbi:MAG: regulatory protein RecX [Schwartzia sp.]|nr:regulatory protein RecX [Schwartzia sp. (in: firmicutes)]
MRKKTGKPKPSALEKAVELLAAREQSKRRLSDKLRLRGYEEEEIDAALARLEERRYLDDEAACARAFQRMYEDGAMSLRQIGQKLLQRGFPAALVRASAPEDEGRDGHERQAAARALRGRFRSPAPRAKMKQFLYRRGFSCEVCDAATDAFLADHPEFMMKETDYEE